MHVRFPQIQEPVSQPACKPEVAVLNQIIHRDSLISHDMTYSPGTSLNIKMI